MVTLSPWGSPREKQHFRPPSADLECKSVRQQPLFWAKTWHLKVETRRAVGIMKKGSPVGFQ